MYPVSGSGGRITSVSFSFIAAALASLSSKREKEDGCAPSKSTGIPEFDVQARNILDFI